MKLGTHIDSGQMYITCIPELDCCYLFIPLCLYFSFCPIFNIEIFRHTFLRSCEAEKIETWYIRGQWAAVSGIPESGCFYFFHFSFSPIFKHYNVFVTLFSGTVRPRSLKRYIILTWTMDGRIVITESCHNIFLQNCEA